MARRKEVLTIDRSTTMIKLLLINSGNIPEQPLLISPPRLALMFTALRLWVSVLFMAVIAANGLLLFATMPLVVVFLYSYYWFTKLWSAYGCSKALLHTLTTIVWGASFIAAPFIRSFILSIAKELL